MVLPVVICGRESWTMKTTEHWKTDAFELWCWRRLLRVPWIAKRSKESVLRKSTLNTHWKDWCRSWSFNALANWCKEPTHWKRPWCWERLRAGGEGGDRGWDGWVASPTQWTWVWASSRRRWRTGEPGVLQSMGCRVGHDWDSEQQQCEQSHTTCMFSSLLSLVMMPRGVTHTAACIGVCFFVSRSNVPFRKWGSVGLFLGFGSYR